MAASATDASKRLAGDEDPHGDAPFLALEPKADQLGSADRNQRAAEPEDGNGEEQAHVTGRKTSQHARCPDDDRGKDQRPARADAVQQRSARYRRDDVDELPRPEDASHGRVAQTKLARDRVHQRRHGRDGQAETEIDQRRAAKHRPAIGLRGGGHVQVRQKTVRTSVRARADEGAGIPLIRVFETTDTRTTRPSLLSSSPGLSRRSTSLLSKHSSDSVDAETSTGMTRKECGNGPSANRDGRRFGLRIRSLRSALAGSQEADRGVALEQIEQDPQRAAARALEPGIGLDDHPGIVSRDSEDVRVNGQGPPW